MTTTKPHYSKRPYIARVIGGGMGGGGVMRFISGEGEPESDLGLPGDVYLDTTNGDLYTNKNGTWSLEMNLVGPQGPKGEQGERGPEGPKGEDGFPSESEWNDLVERVQTLEDEIFSET